MKIALVHDDLIQFGGAERVLLAMHDLWPEAPIYTSVASFDWINKCAKLKIDLRTSFMQKLPFVEKLNRYYAPFLFHILAFESFNLDEFDIVLSSSSRFAHGVFTKPQTKHICYMNTPGRMIWDQSNYFKKERFSENFFLDACLSHMRIWDYAAAHRVDYFISNSKAVSKRIKRFYNRDSLTIYPFVEYGKFRNIKHKKGEYLLVISRLLSWKRIDTAVVAANKLGLKLKVVGDGPDYSRLKEMSGSNIEFLGFVSETDKIDLLSKCSALIQTQHEDFGIVPLEAMAAGKPVIAYGKGGVLETVVPGKTGEFFYEQSADALMRIISEIDLEKYLPYECENRAKLFDKIAFRKRLKHVVEEIYLRNI